MASRPSSVTGPGARRFGLLGVLAVGTLLFAAVLQRHDALGGWLFFHYLRSAFFAALFASACLAAGHTLLVRVLGRSLPLEEHVTIAFALGVLAFFLTTFTCGVLGFLGPTFFLACPSLLLLFGARKSLRTLEALKRHARGIRWSLPLWQVALMGCGAVGIAVVWFPILTPQNASFDARWYHLSIAQQYVAEGGIHAFREG
ncbi:MAG TPA: hypothetical protein VNG33_02945 [Polyangiaceae bacterium]|nr:hypothetical protein [Polyangiaceae bacterium]